MFNTEEYNEIESKNYITPGIHEVEILSVTCDEKAQEGEYIEITVKNIGEPDDTAMSRKFYFKGNAGQYSGGKITAILKACLPEAQAKVSAPTLVEFADKLNAVLTGKQYRQKFTGREYASGEGTNWAAEYPIARTKEENGVKYSLSVESITEGTAYPMVPADETNLTFDSTNTFDMKPLNDDEKPTNSDAVEEKSAW